MIDRRHRGPGRTVKVLTAVVLFAGTAMSIAGCASQTNSALLPPDSGLASNPQVSTLVEPKIRVDATVSVTSISGPPQAVWDRLIVQLNTATQESHIALLNFQGAAADYRLQGYVVAAPAKKNIAVSYIWDVFDKSGARVGRTAGSQTVDKASGDDPWSKIPDPVLRMIADQAVLAVRTRNNSKSASKGAATPITPALPVTPAPEVPKRLAPRPAAPGPGTGTAAKPRREEAVLNAALTSR